VKLQPDEKQALKSFSNDLIPVLRVELNTPGFWGNADRVSSLQGLIGDRLVDTCVGIVVDRYEGLANDMVQLAKARQLDLLA
jgi:hypothetical protein